MQKFCKRGWTYFEKRVGAAASSLRRSTGRQCLKNLLGYFKGGRGGGGGQAP